MEDENEAPRIISNYIHVIPLKPHTARLEIADWQIELESSEESPEQIVDRIMIFKSALIFNRTL